LKYQSRVRHTKTLRQDEGTTHMSGEFPNA
jgi:hypothetical protein